MAVRYVCVYVCMHACARMCPCTIKASLLASLPLSHHYKPCILEHTHTVHFKLDIRKILGMAGIVFNPGQTSEPSHSFLTHF